MNRPVRLLFLFALWAFSTQGFSQTGTAIAPVSEFRGAWIATVDNIDWPSKPGLTVERQQVEFDSILDVLKAMGMNAVLVQVRPAADAFYPTALAPWSKFLTGQQGIAPQPLYDPLDYMIKAAHTRRMEFHAWMNPYRATIDLDTASLAPTHPLRSLPKDRQAQWFFRYGTRYYFNPANPLVINHLSNVVKDILIRYDVDGIHFDDYFYPYKEPNETLNDYNDFAYNPRGFTNIEDWRRDNVNQLIQRISKEIKAVKPYVRFGISPFGIWRNEKQDANNGSRTNGMSAYDDLYADVRLWLQKGWIDYVAPQLYWSIGFPPADYKTLAEWWNRNAFGRHVYIGHAAYKINRGGTADPNWNQPDQISQQVAYNRTLPNIQGSIYFSAKQLLRNPLGLQDTLINRLYANPALLPPTAGLSKVPPATPQVCRIAGTPSSIKIAWNVCDVLLSQDAPYYFAVYRFNGDGLGDFKDTRNLLTISPFNDDRWVFEDQSVLAGEYYTYAVKAYNRFNVESSASEPMTVKKTRKGIKRKKKLFGFLF